MDDLVELFERYRSHGDLEALGAVFDRAAPRLLALALHLCGNPADAEDAQQATFVLAMRKAAAFDRSQRLDPWLAGILIGEARNLVRRAGRRATETLPDLAGGGPDPVATAERAQLVAELRLHVDALPFEQRQALLLQLQHGLSPAEIAEVLDVPPGTVRMRLHRGLAALRRLLPAGLAVLLVEALPASGLAAVRHAVLHTARETAAAQGLVPTVIGGLFAMKKALSVVALVAVAALAWWWLDAGAQVGRTKSATQVAAPAGAADAVAAPDPPALGADTAPSTRVAVATADGSLLVRVRLVERATDGAPGKPVADTAIQVWSGDVPLVPFDGSMRELRTNAAGEASFPGLAPGRWQMLCAADREAEPRAVLVEPGRQTLVEVARPGARIVRGHVVAADGLPVAGAQLWLSRGELFVQGRDRVSEPVELRLRIAGESDAEGRFEIAAAADEKTIGARKAGHAPSFGCATDAARVRLVLGQAWAAVSGVVCDATGQPIPGAVVVVTPAGQDTRRAADGTLLLPRVPQLSHTDALGRFEFDGLPPGVQKVIVKAGPRMAWRDVAVAAHARAEIELRLIDGITVVGTVRRADGTPAREFEVCAIPKRGAAGGYSEGFTRADGTFLLTPVQARRFVVSVGLHGPGPALVDREFAELAPGVLRCDLVLPDLGQLSGRVVDARGEPLPYWLVCAVDPATGGFRASALTAADGRFELRNLLGATFRVFAHAADGDSKHPPVELTPVRPGAAPLELRVPDTALPRGAVAARLVAAGGAALADTEVVLRRTESSQGWPWMSNGRKTRSSADGTFRFAHLSPGEFELVLDPGTGAAQSFTQFSLDPGQDLDLGALRMPSLATLRVEFAHADGSPWRATLPFLCAYDATGHQLGIAWQSDAVARQARVEPKRYRVEVVGDDLSAAPQEVELEAGARRTLRFAVAIGRTRELRFNGDGKDKPEYRTPLHVEVRSADGAVVVEQDVQALMPDLRGFRYWYLDHTFPCGRYVVTARTGSGRRYSTTFEVRADLEDPSRVDVPAID